MKVSLFGCFAVALVLSVGALQQLTAQETPKEETPGSSYLDKQTGIKFPAKIGNLKFDSAKDFGDPKLGVGIRYRSPDALQIDAIIYNLGLKTIPADPADPTVKQQADQALGDIEAAAERGLYKDLKVISREVVPLSKAKGAPQAHKLSLAFTLSEKPRESCLYLLVYKDHFVKIRATWFPATKEASEKDVAGMVEWLAGEMKR